MASRRPAAVILVLSLIALTGCTPTQLMGVRATPHGLEFMACDSQSTQAIEVWVSPADSTPTDYQLVWESTGDVEITSGNILQYGVDLPGMTTEAGPLPIDLSESIVAISFEHLSAGGTLIDEVQAHFFGADITSEDWLDESGGHSTEPCQ